MTDRQHLLDHTEAVRQAFDARVTDDVDIDRMLDIVERIRDAR